MKRITGFMDAIDAARGATEAGAGVQAAAEPRPDLALDGVTLALPDGRVLLRDAAARIEPGEAVLVAGPSGSGKSTLFRAIAGIWPFGAGRVRVPQGASVLFLPQRPYLPLGSLHRAVCYPRPVTDFTEAEVRAALEDAGLGHPRRGWRRRMPGTGASRAASSSAWRSPAPCC
ncbi:ATP-binding cassette domain-containing protein [Dankookia sp. P2]|uniref:ATP-binding cassette domain-containing protein n=1 Tax=Dankookia sp. P2 TaxID=3423955 RepID=UPI003D674E7F